MTDKELKSQINILFKKLADLYDSYCAAHDKLSNPSFKTYLVRRKFAIDLLHQNMERAIDRRQTFSSIDRMESGDYHHAYQNLEECLNEGDGAIYDQILRNEETFVREIEELTEKIEFPQKVKELLQAFSKDSKYAVEDLKNIAFQSA